MEKRDKNATVVVSADIGVTSVLRSLTDPSYPRDTKVNMTLFHFNASKPRDGEIESDLVSEVAKISIT